MVQPKARASLILTALKTIPGLRLNGTRTLCQGSEIRLTSVRFYYNYVACVLIYLRCEHVRLQSEPRAVSRFHRLFGFRLHILMLAIASARSFLIRGGSP
jgi:hypothetical protein